MQIQINTDHNVEGHAVLIEHVRGVTEHSLSRFSKQITRVEVHLSYENADRHAAHRMPLGLPGMEMSAPVHSGVLLIGSDGFTRVFASHGPRA